ncbi:MAG: UDP-N-acetylmuramate dehydrogenase [Cyclobacteriaceae bacterium]|nr:UDP-N-acetylmuramate dehydrogenase [Cyclobacteriaceae bacterium]
MQEYVNIKEFNTFGLSVKSRYFIEIRNLEDLNNFRNEVFLKEKTPFLILGGGSNILFTKDFPGIILKNELKGISISEGENDTVLITCASGEVWHELVLFTISNNFGGIENLSLIPGTAGAAPIQNIGAYGVELKDSFERLQALDMNSGEIKTFTKEECKFGYRDSIFKRELKNRYFIVSITLRLKKNHQPDITYGAISQLLKEKNIDIPTIKDVSEAVIQIRKSKLPDPVEIGNSGSFFKNPVISMEHFEYLQEKYSEMPSYPAAEGKKIPAGWLIEKCGWKGYKSGNIGVHKKQALVLVNYGGGQGRDIKILAKKIQNSVKDTFNISLESEVNII